MLRLVGLHFDLDPWQWPIWEWVVQTSSKSTTTVFVTFSKGRQAYPEDANPRQRASSTGSFDPIILRGIQLKPTVKHTGGATIRTQVLRPASPGATVQGQTPRALHFVTLKWSDHCTEDDHSRECNSTRGLRGTQLLARSLKVVPL